jgi:hypothetical protein
VTCSLRPAYCQVRRKMRSRSRVATSASVYQDAGSDAPRSISAASEPGSSARSGSFMEPMVPEPEEARQAARRAVRRGREAPCNLGSARLSAYSRYSHAGRGGRTGSRLTRSTGDAGWCHPRGLTEGCRACGRCARHRRSGRVGLVGRGRVGDRGARRSRTRHRGIARSARLHAGSWHLGRGSPCQAETSQRQRDSAFPRHGLLLSWVVGAIARTRYGHRPCQVRFSGERRQGHVWCSERPIARRSGSMRRGSAYRAGLSRRRPPARPGGGADRHRSAPSIRARGRIGLGRPAFAPSAPGCAPLPRTSPRSARGRGRP